MSDVSPKIQDGDRITPYLLKIAGVVVLGAIMSILDITVVSVAIPTFSQTFDASIATVAWTMTAYSLALATVIPLAGWAADRFGTKRLYIAALTMFTAGSVLCAFADSISLLVTFRVLQGLGGGMLMPLGMTIMTRAAGPHRIGRLMAVLGIPMLLGPIGGPILGGWLIDVASWRWIFLINLPIGIIAIAFAWFTLPKDRSEPSESFDWIGMLLLSPGLALFLFGVSSIAEGSGSITFGPRVWANALIGALLIVGFVFYSFKPKHPLVDLRLFKHRQLTIAAISLFVFVIAFMGAGLLFPSYFLQIRGETTLAAGLLMAPQGIGAMLTMPIGGVLADRLPIGRIVPVGLVLIAAGFAAFTQIDATTSYVLLLGSLFIMGLGMGLTMMPLMTSALKTLTDHEVARGSTLINTIQQIGGSVGSAIMSVILTTQLAKSAVIPGLIGPNGDALTEAGLGIATRMMPKVFANAPLPQGVDRSVLEALANKGLEFASSAFGDTFMVALALVLVTLIPVAFLPRRKLAVAIGEQDSSKAPVMIH